MILLRANFPHGRTRDGTLAAYSDGTLIAGPWPCLGRAAGDEARRHNNPSRDPRLNCGDHPLGEWSVVSVEEKPEALRRTYGRWFARLRAVSGEAIEATIAGRAGIGIHSGALDASDIDGDGDTADLRRTNGCLRTTDEAMTWIAARAAEGVPMRLESGVWP